MEYMSQAGYDKLKNELDELSKVRLPEVIQSISEARDKGDLSENYEYRAAKREQGRVLGRIRFLQRVLEHTRVLAPRADDGTVHLLSRVSLTNLGTGRQVAYTIVSPHEANAREGKISQKSPIGQALMGRRAGDTVRVSVPVGVIQLRIEAIETV